LTYLAAEQLKSRNEGQSWNWVPFRRVAQIRRQPNTTSDAPLLACSASRGVELRPADGGRQLPSAETIVGYWLVHPRDLVFNPMWAIEGGVAVSELFGAVSTAYRVYQLRPNMWPRFLHYWCRSAIAIDQYRLLVRGITTFDRSVSREDFEGMPIPVPPISSQHQIASFLDAETARLDQVIGNRLKQLQLLHARQQAEIDSVSGATGQTFSLKRVAPFVTSGPRGWGDRVGPSGIPFIRIGNLQRDSIQLDLSDVVHVEPGDDGEAARSRVRKGDVLVSITADIGTVGIADHDVEGASVSQHVAIVRPENCLPEWLAFVLKSGPVRGQLLAAQYGGTKQQLALDDLRDLRIPLADNSTQVAVARRLMRAANRYDRIGAGIHHVVGLLQERREAMITAALTGQIPIPGVAA
jgi:type I restriction enzyme S subunit